MNPALLAFYATLVGRLSGAGDSMSLHAGKGKTQA